jgi:hypothetical protein
MIEIAGGIILAIVLLLFGVLFAVVITIHGSAGTRQRERTKSLEKWRAEQEEVRKRHLKEAIEARRAEEMSRKGQRNRL